MKIDQENIAAFFGGKFPRGRSVWQQNELLVYARSGIPSEAFNAFFSMLVKLGSPIVGKLESRRITALLSGVVVDGESHYAQSEHVMHVAIVLVQAETVIADKAGLSEFLFSPHQLLNGVRPIELLGTKKGCQKVLSILEDAANGMPV